MPFSTSKVKIKENLKCVSPLHGDKLMYTSFYSWHILFFLHDWFRTTLAWFKWSDNKRRFDVSTLQWLIQVPSISGRLNSVISTISHLIVQVDLIWKASGDTHFKFFQVSTSTWCEIWKIILSTLFYGTPWWINDLSYLCFKFGDNIYSTEYTTMSLTREGSILFHPLSL